MSYIGNAVPSVTSLGGDLDVNGHQIKSTSNGNIQIVPDGSGTVTIDQLVFPTGTGGANQVLQSDGSGNLSFTNQSGGGGGSQNLFSTIAVSGQSDVVADATTDTLTLVAGGDLSITTNASSDTITFTATTEVSTDTSPILGGNLDVSTYDIVSTSNNNIDILPNGTGKVNIDGNGSTGGVVVSDGLIEIKTGTGNVAELRLYCENTSSPHYLALKAPAHASGWSGNYSLTLPTTDGNSGEYLKTDGSGVLSWDTPSGGGGGSTGNITFSNSDIRTNDQVMNFYADDDDNDTGNDSFVFYGGPTAQGNITFLIHDTANQTNQMWKTEESGISYYSKFVQYHNKSTFYCNEGANTTGAANAYALFSNRASSAGLKLGTTSGNSVEITDEYGGTPFYKFPRATPSNGDVLTASDGSGTLAWSAPSGGGGGNTDILTIQTTSSAPSSVAQDTVKLYESSSALHIRSYRGNGPYPGVVLVNSAGTQVVTMYTDGDIAAVKNMIAAKFIVEGGSAAGRIEMQAPNTSDHISLNVPSSLSNGSTDYILPEDGSNGEYLKTDGSGNLSWSSAGGSRELVQSEDLSNTSYVELDMGTTNGYAFEIFLSLETETNQPLNVMYKGTSGNYGSFDTRWMVSKTQYNNGTVSHTYGQGTAVPIFHENIIQYNQNTSFSPLFSHLTFHQDQQAGTTQHRYPQMMWRSTGGNNPNTCFGQHYCMTDGRVRYMRMEANSGNLYGHIRMFRIKVAL